MTTKNPDQTRAKILEAAFYAFFRQGFTATSLDAILAETGVTKGALYHHFANKDELGFAVIDEVIGEYIRRTWIRPLNDTSDPVGTLIGTIEHNRANMQAEAAKLGCPLNSLTQEMAARNDAFRVHAAALYEEWRVAIANAFRRGREIGTVRDDVDGEAAATFIIAVHQGLSGTMKSSGGTDRLDSALPVFLTFLKSLRPTSDVTD